MKSPIMIFKSVLDNDNSFNEHDETVNNDDGASSPADEDEEEKAVLKRHSSYLQIDQVPESFYYQNNEKGMQ